MIDTLIEMDVVFPPLSLLVTVDRSESTPDHVTQPSDHQSVVGKRKKCVGKWPPFYSTHLPKMAVCIYRGQCQGCITGCRSAGPKTDMNRIYLRSLQVLILGWIIAITARGCTTTENPVMLEPKEKPFESSEAMSEDSHVTQVSSEGFKEELSFLQPNEPVVVIQKIPQLFTKELSTTKKPEVVSNKQLLKKPLFLFGEKRFNKLQNGIPKLKDMPAEKKKKVVEVGEEENMGPESKMEPDSTQERVFFNDKPGFHSGQINSVRDVIQSTQNKDRGGSSNFQGRDREATPYRRPQFVLSPPNRHIFSPRVQEAIFQPVTSPRPFVSIQGQGPFHESQMNALRDQANQEFQNPEFNHPEFRGFGFQAIPNHIFQGFNFQGGPHNNQHFHQQNSDRFMQLQEDNPNFQSNKESFSQQGPNNQQPEGNPPNGRFLQRDRDNQIAGPHNNFGLQAAEFHRQHIQGNPRMPSGSTNQSPPTSENNGRKIQAFLQRQQHLREQNQNFQRTNAEELESEKPLRTLNKFQVSTSIEEVPAEQTDRQVANQQFDEQKNRDFEYQTNQGFHNNKQEFLGQVNQVFNNPKKDSSSAQQNERPQNQNSQEPELIKARILPGPRNHVYFTQPIGTDSLAFQRSTTQFDYPITSTTTELPSITIESKPITTTKAPSLGLLARGAGNHKKSAQMNQKRAPFISKQQEPKTEKLSKDKEGKAVAASFQKKPVIKPRVPRTNFTCAQQTGPGFYADSEAACRVFHSCDVDMRKNSFLCPAGTLFNQLIRVCDWPENVDCVHSRMFYNNQHKKPQNHEPTDNDGDGAENT